jgi:hypothetical protein
MLKSFRSFFKYQIYVYDDYSRLFEITPRSYSFRSSAAAAGRGRGDGPILNEREKTKNEIIRLYWFMCVGVFRCQRISGIYCHQHKA